VTTSGRRGCRVAARSSFQIDISEIVVHEADEPDAVIDFLDSEFLACKHGGDVDLLRCMSTQASPIIPVLHASGSPITTRFKIIATDLDPKELPPGLTLPELE